MKNFVVAFEKPVRKTTSSSGTYLIWKMGSRTIRARNENEAIAKCRQRVVNSQWHFIREVK